MSLANMQPGGWGRNDVCGGSGRLMGAFSFGDGGVRGCETLVGCDTPGTGRIATGGRVGLCLNNTEVADFN